MKPVNKIRFKTEWLNYIIVFLVMLFLFSSSAKSWLLKQFVSVGIFNNADVAKNDSAVLQSIEDFSFTDTSGNTYNTSSLRGKVVFINFWATWCPPCRAEMPSIQSMFDKLKSNSDYFFLTINEDDNPAIAKSFMQQYHYTLPLLFRNNNEVSSQIFTGTLPTTIVVDKHGKIRLRHEGISNYDSESFLQQMQALAKE